MAISKGFVYLEESTDIAVKTLIGSFKFRTQILEDRLSLKIWNLINLIKQSNRFYNKNIHNNKSLLDMFTNFLEKEESSSDEEVESKKKQLYVKVLY